MVQIYLCLPFAMAIESVKLDIEQKCKAVSGASRFGTFANYA